MTNEVLTEKKLVDYFELQNNVYKSLWICSLINKQQF